jgi:hypothetical protein
MNECDNREWLIIDDQEDILDIVRRYVDCVNNGTYDTFDEWNRVLTDIALLPNFQEVKKRYSEHIAYLRSVTHFYANKTGFGVKPYESDKTVFTNALNLFYNPSFKRNPVVNVDEQPKTDCVLEEDDVMIVMLDTMLDFIFGGSSSDINKNVDQTMKEMYQMCIIEGGSTSEDPNVKLHINAYADIVRCLMTMGWVLPSQWGVTEVYGNFITEPNKEDLYYALHMLRMKMTPKRVSKQESEAYRQAYNSHVDRFNDGICETSTTCTTSTTSTTSTTTVTKPNDDDIIDSITVNLTTNYPGPIQVTFPTLETSAVVNKPEDPVFFKYQCTVLFTDVLQGNDDEIETNVCKMMTGIKNLCHLYSKSMFSQHCNHTYSDIYDSLLKLGWVGSFDAEPNFKAYFESGVTKKEIQDVWSMAFMKTTSSSTTIKPRYPRHLKQFNIPQQPPLQEEKLDARLEATDLFITDGFDKMIDFITCGSSSDINKNVAEIMKFMELNVPMTQMIDETTKKRRIVYGHLVQCLKSLDWIPPKDKESYGNFRSEPDKEKLVSALIDLREQYITSV